MSESTWLFGLRHGESQANAAAEVAWDPARAAPGLGLTPAGREAVARNVAAAGLSGALLVVSSDLARAAETAAIACQALREAGAQARLRFDPRLRERRFGAAEGASNRLYEPAWELDARDPTHRLWGAESAQDVAERLLALVRELRRARGQARVLLVSHGDPLQIASAALRGRSPGLHRQEPHWEPAQVRALPSPDAG